MKEGNLNKFQMVRFQIWHSGKGKATEKVTSSMVARSYGKEGVNMWSTEEVQGSESPEWYYNGRYVLLYICQNPQNVKSDP